MIMSRRKAKLFNLRNFSDSKVYSVSLVLRPGGIALGAFVKKHSTREICRVL